MRPLLSRRGWIGLSLGAMISATILTGSKSSESLLQRIPAFVKTEIHILVWKSYLPPDLIQGFQDATGIRVHVDYLNNNDELPARLAERKYDLVMPSSFKVKELAKRGFLRRLNRDNLPNLANVDTGTHNSKFDPNNDYSVPYIWGATGIGYRSDAIDGIPKSWSSMFGPLTKPAPATLTVPGLTAAAPTPSWNPKPESDRVPADLPAPRNRPRRIAMLDDGRFALGCALVYQGVRIERAGPKEIEAAGELIKGLAGQVIFLNVNNVPEMLARNELDLDMVMAWSGDVTSAMRGFLASDETQAKFPEESRKLNILVKNPSVRLSLPLEGTVVFRDNFAIPANAANPAAGERLLNYLLVPKVAGRMTSYSAYANTLKLSLVMPYTDRFVANSASYFTHPSGTKHNYHLDEIPEETEGVYQRVWGEVKAVLKPETYPEIKKNLYPIPPQQRANL